MIGKIIRKLIFRRRQAYRALFTADDALRPAAQIVLSDLRRFCRATSTPAVVSHVTQNIDPMASAIAIGRQEVWHRIMQHIHVSDADLYRLVENEEDQTE